MTFKKTLKNIASARAVTLSTALCAALLTSACATGPAKENTEFTDEHWQSVAESNVLGATSSQPLIAPTGTLSANKQRKIALRQLAVSSIRDDNPGAYTVVKGDTLWDISGRFLSRPWLWPEIWHVNPQIENPHLIYPGDQIELAYVDGSPRLQLIRANSKSRQSSPIGTIPIDAIKNFLVSPLVVSEDEIINAAYVAATEEGRLISSVNDHVFVRGAVAGSRYSIYRPGKALADPDTQEVLGYEALHVANASLVKNGDPAKMIITQSKRETFVGDRLMVDNAATTPAYFQPRAASTTRPGKIISIVDAVARAGTNQVVVLNLGDTDGVQAGDTFSVMSNDRVIRDSVDQSRGEFFTVEGDQSAVVMVFRTFNRVSYGLIMSASRSVRLYDRVSSTADQL